MVIGQNVTVFGIHDDARTGTRNFARAAFKVGQTEESSEHLVTVWCARLHRLADANINHCRRNLFHQWRKTRQWLAVDAVRQRGLARHGNEHKQGSADQAIGFAHGAKILIKIIRQAAGFRAHRKPPGKSYCIGSAERPVNESLKHSLFAKGQEKILKSSFQVPQTRRPAFSEDAGRLRFVAVPVSWILR